MVPRIATDAVATGSHHAGAQFVKDLERCLVTVDAELALKLDSRYAWRVGRNQIRGPKPNRQRRLAVLHDRSGHEPVVFLAFPADQHMRAVFHPVRFTGFATPDTNKLTRPADRLEVGRASRVVRKELLEFRQRAREWEIADRADAGDLGEPLAAFIGTMPSDEPGIDFVDLHLRLRILPSLGREQLPSQGGQVLIGFDAFGQRIEGSP